MASPLNACALSILSLTMLAEQQPPSPSYNDDATVFARRYGISEVILSYRPAAELPYVTARPIEEWMRQRFNARISSSRKQGASVVSLSASLPIDVREDHWKTRAEYASVSVTLADTLEGGGRAAANYLSQVPAVFSKGSFSGIPIGDWTATYLDKGVGATIVFFRRNAFVYIFCMAPTEITKSDQFQRVILPDASFHLRCEKLALDVDTRVQELPTKQ